MASPTKAEDNLTWRHRALVAAPLALALLLVAISIVFFLGQREPEVAPVESQPVTPVALERAEIPVKDPSAPAPYSIEEETPRFGGRYPRWNLTEFPPGWDHALAENLHSWFERMEYDPRDHSTVIGLEEAREDFREFLSSLGPEAVPTLAGILDVEADFVDRRFLLYALGELGPETEDATFALRDFFVGRAENPQARSELGHAVVAMSKLKNESSFDMFHDMIAREDPAVRSYRPKFIQALGEHPRRQEALGTFVDRLHEDEDPTARNYAAQALGKLRSRDTLGDLYSAFSFEDRWATKQTILGTIGKIGDSRSIPFLESQARTATDPKIRLSAAGALRRYEDPQARQVLRELARSEPDPKVRKNVQGWVYPAAE